MTLRRRHVPFPSKIVSKCLAVFWMNCSAWTMQKQYTHLEALSKAQVAHGNSVNTVSERCTEFYTERFACSSIFQTRNVLACSVYKSQLRWLPAHDAMWLYVGSDRCKIFTIWWDSWRSTELTRQLWTFLASHLLIHRQFLFFLNITSFTHCVLFLFIQ